MKRSTTAPRAAVNDCRLLKNALQADPVATGPADSRYITKAYLGDLDGKIWRFDLGLNGSDVPVISQLVSLVHRSVPALGQRPRTTRICVDGHGEHR